MWFTSNRFSTLVFLVDLHAQNIRNIRMIIRIDWGWWRLERYNSRCYILKSGPKREPFLVQLKSFDCTSFRLIFWFCKCFSIRGFSSRKSFSKKKKRFLAMTSTGGFRFETFEHTLLNTFEPLEREHKRVSAHNFQAKVYRLEPFFAIESFLKSLPFVEAGLRSSERAH